MTFPIQALAESNEISMALAVAFGFGFGFFLERAGFGNSLKLAPQFYGTEMRMLKVMFTAIVTALLGVAVLSGFGLLDLRALGDSATSITYLWPMIVGGFIIGIGIMVSGYCPGTSIVGIASGKIDALFAFVGVMIGQLIWASIETRPLIARFHNSGDLNHLYLYDLFRVPPAVIAAGVVLMALGMFLAGEKIEKLLSRSEQPAGPARRLVFAGIGLFGFVALATLAMPTGTQAKAREMAAIGQLDLARRIFDEPWKIRIVDVRPTKDCATRRIPGSECVPPEGLAQLRLAEVDPAAAKDLVLVGERDLQEVPSAVAAYPGRVYSLQEGFAGWQAFALAPPPSLALDATPEDREHYRLRAGIQAAMTGMKAAPPPPAPTDVGPRKPRKGGGCSG